MKRSQILAAGVLVSLAATGDSMISAAQAQQPGMTFFVTSAGKGNGADLGGLEGADAHCVALAKTAGSSHTNWRAYLSTTAPGGDAGVNARDRIGLKDTRHMNSWNSSHGTRGCSQELLKASGGDGLYYCFVAN